MNFRKTVSTLEIELEELKKKINENLFRIQIKSRDIRTREEIEIYGTYISGQKDIDDYAGDEVRTIYISIENMVDYYKRGVTLFIPRQEDTDAIYKLIDEYLIKWKLKIESSFHPEDAPLDELLIYEGFAQSMFGIAKYSISKIKPFSSPFLESLRALPIAPSSEHSLRNINFKKENPVKDKIDDRPTLDNFFKARKLPIKKVFR